MVDVNTNERIKVSTNGDPLWPYILLTVDQLPFVKKVLESEKVEYWVDSDAISINNEPFVATINLAKGTEPARVQQLLDAA